MQTLYPTSHFHAYAMPTDARLSFACLRLLCVCVCVCVLSCCAVLQVKHAKRCRVRHQAQATALDATRTDLSTEQTAHNDTKQEFAAARLQWAAERAALERRAADAEAAARDAERRQAHAADAEAAARAAAAALDEQLRTSEQARLSHVTRAREAEAKCAALEAARAADAERALDDKASITTALDASRKEVSRLKRKLQKSSESNHEIKTQRKAFEHKAFAGYRAAAAALEARYKDTVTSQKDEIAKLHKRVAKRARAGRLEERRRPWRTETTLKSRATPRSPRKTSSPRWRKITTRLWG